MTGRGGIYQGPDGEELYGDGRVVEEPGGEPMSAKEQMIAELALEQFERQFKGLDYSHVGRKELAVDFAANFAKLRYDAGYRAAIEQAAKVAEVGLTGIALNAQPTLSDLRKVAAAIRELKP